MNHFIKAFFLVVVIITLSIRVKAQLNYRKGYIITNTNDTLYGKINNGSNAANARICLFKEQNKHSVIKFHPAEIKAYRFNDGKYYATKQIFKQGIPVFVFLDVLIEGKVNLYHYWGSRSSAFYIERNDNLVCLSNEDIIVQPTTIDSDTHIPDSKFVIKSRAYRDSLKSVFRDSKIVKNQIPGIDYDLNSIQNITKSYINEVCKGENCIHYERNSKSDKSTFGALYGIRMNQISFLPSTDGLNSIEDKSTMKSNLLTSFPFGLFYNIPLTRISERFSFQIEVNYQHMDYYQEFTNSYFGPQIEIISNTFGIPLLLKYEFLSAKLSPSVAIGKETGFVLNSKVLLSNPKDMFLNHTQKGGLFFELGMRYKLTSKIALFSNLRVQSNNNLIVKEQYKSMNYHDIASNNLSFKEYNTLSSTIYFGLNF